jgi:hypothetical protein
MAAWQDQIVQTVKERLDPNEARAVALWLLKHPDKMLGVLERLRDAAPKDGDFALVNKSDLIREIRLAMRGGVGDG